MKLTICVNFRGEPSSYMYCREADIDWPTVPRIGDEIELLPGNEEWSDWTEPVERIYFHGDGSVELHTSVNLAPKSEDERTRIQTELAAVGFEPPGGFTHSVR